jgi:predicted RecA/RadA family phage recombinase
VATPQFVFVQEGDIVSYTNNTVNMINPGDPVPWADAFGVAVYGIAPGATGQVVVHGVFLCPADPAAVFSEGDKLYWDAANKFITNNATGTNYAGYAAQAKVAGAGQAYLKLNF